MIRRAFLALFALLIAVPSIAQEPTAAFRARAEMLVDVLKSGSAEADYFAPGFIAQVPPSMIEQVAAQLRTSYGAVEQLASIEAANSQSGVVRVRYAQATLRFEMSIEPAAPNRVIGLLVVGTEPRNDNAAKLIGDFKALPGVSGLIITPLGKIDTTPLIAHNPDQQLAIGSGFKLWILAELARSIAAKKHKWSEVVPLGAPSLPSGITQSWPKGMAITLQSLAVLAISISDNSASDTLLETLGRDRVGRMVAETGHSAPDNTLPLLSTVEGFALKMSGNADLRALWASGDQRQRSALLQGEANRLMRSSIVPAELGGNPQHIDSVEWFASPADMAKTLDWLRTKGGVTTLDILKVNSGIPVGDAARFSYLGFKGGSEPGVIALNFLVRARSGQWYAVTGGWNNPKAPVDNDRFTALMIRALALIP